MGKVGKEDAERGFRSGWVAGYSNESERSPTPPKPIGRHLHKGHPCAPVGKVGESDAERGARLRVGGGHSNKPAAFRVAIALTLRVPLKERFRERIQVPIQYRFHVTHLVVRPMVLGHLIRVQDIRTNL